MLRILFAITLLASSLPAQTRTIAEKLGYPKNSRLLILHADDLGAAHSINAATFEALDKGAISSASVMIPTPWISEVAAYARAHPDADLGIHLVLTSEWDTYKWGSVAPSEKVPSLLDSAGIFATRETTVAERAKPSEAEIELRAQLDRARTLGIHLTHADSHMRSLFTTAPLFRVYMKVAREYRIPFMTSLDNTPGEALAELRPTDPVMQVILGAGPDITPDHWKQYYLDVLKNLKPGVSELIVHLGFDDAELEAVMVNQEPWGAAWRQRDYDVVMSPEFKKALRDNRVILVKWKDVYRAAHMR